MSSKRDNSQNKMASAIDHAIQRDLTNGTVRKEPVQKTFLTFDDRYPNVGLWEIDTMEMLGARRTLPLSELNIAMHTTGLAARDWVREHFNKKVEPKEMARIIKNVLC